MTAICIETVSSQESIEKSRIIHAFWNQDVLNSGFWLLPNPDSFRKEDRIAEILAKRGEHPDLQ
jgi:hypothetical protein